MTKKELTKRYILFLFSLFVSAIGVAITKKGELGVSPVSSVANILSIRFTFFSLGNWLIIWNCILILGQIVLLRRKFQLIQLLQIPLSFLFGYFTDFGLWIFSSYTPKMYWEGTIYAVLFTGIMVKMFRKLLMPSVNRLLLEKGQ